MIELAFSNSNIGSHKLREFGIWIRNYNFPSLPARKSGDIDIPGQYGSYRVVRQKRKQSSFEIECVMQSYIEGEIQKGLFELSALLSDDAEPLKMELSDFPGYYFYANLESVDEYRVIKGIDNYYASTTVTFTMNDPFFYDSSTPEFGPFSYGNYTLRNKGYEQGVKILLTSTDVSSTITSGQNNVVLVINGESLMYTNGITVDKPVTIDTDKCVVLVGEDEILTDWKGTMPHIKHGDNIVVFSRAQASVKLTIQFHERYM